MHRTYVGIDLAAQPRRTGLAVLREDGERCVLDTVRVGAGDDALIGAVSGAAKAGVDVPLGWPRRFVELLAAHAALELSAPESTGDDWRRDLAMRATDRVVHRRTALTPLSVATDRIAHPALRWAGIEARMRDLGLDVARDGSGTLCEVYPAAALRIWGLAHRGYKGDKNQVPRAALVDTLSAREPSLDWNGHRALCASADDALDAVLAALIAREVDHGRAVPPDPEHLELAHQEGWIWLPRETPQEVGL
ncbi:hypothetical protein CFK38_07520 [Brachybacterium vulturis]|uniref:DUF429 domain-containing protein n=1 Tax=Brachybacterium vulturis TaxID=2017484 RepID=A0A291GM19_9MICO|nr:DUF429 domain-containing protein [Brachybacterium vulturis]ATG51389.1 hypothetical protein CFK38_07520 [Brachybacterium vulturis]